MQAVCGMRMRRVGKWVIIYVRMGVGWVVVNVRKSYHGGVLIRNGWSGFV